MAFQTDFPDVNFSPQGFGVLLKRYKTLRRDRWSHQDSVGRCLITERTPFELTAHTLAYRTEHFVSEILKDTNVDSCFR